MTNSKLSPVFPVKKKNSIAIGLSEALLGFNLVGIDLSRIKSCHALL